MERWTLTPGKGIDTLERGPVPGTPPPPGWVAVRVRAVSLNYRDLVVARSFYSKSVKPEGLVPCSDGAGEVEAAGDGVALRPGDRVAGLFFPNWLSGPPSAEAHAQGLGAELDGMLSQRVLLKAESVVPVPAGYSFEEAACLPCAALTAWHALYERVPLRAGQTLLVLGSGGVSVAALQMAKASGARVIATTGSREKVARLETLGADAVVNYRERPDWEKAVKEVTSGRGVDHVLETGGGGTLDKSVACLATGGHIGLLGILGGPGSLTNPFLLVVKNATVSGIFVGSKEHFLRMNVFLERHAIRPVVDRVFPFEEAPEAYRYLESATHIGKVVIRTA